MVVTFYFFGSKGQFVLDFIACYRFFIGPIQASSRSVLVKEIKAKTNYLHLVYTLCSEIFVRLGPLLIGVIIDFSGSIRMGMLIIPIFFLALLPFLKKSMFKVSYPSKN